MRVEAEPGAGLCFVGEWRILPRDRGGRLRDSRTDVGRGFRAGRGLVAREDQRASGGERESPGGRAAKGPGVHVRSNRNARSGYVSGVPQTFFLLSPARCDGRRAHQLLSPNAAFPLAAELREPHGAAIGEVFAFLSGLYFRGKLTYARQFAPPSAIRVITTNRGLLPPDEPVGPRDLADFASVDLSEAGEEFLVPFLRDARRLRTRAATGSRIVLLGSIATNKYVAPLVDVFGDELLFPRDFIGRGDMSRGGLMLRSAAAKQELDYIPVATAVRHGKRPPKLAPLR